MTEGTRKRLTHLGALGKLEVREGRIVCPICGSRTDQVILPDTRAAKLPVWCRRCKRQLLVTISDGECQCQSASACLRHIVEVRRFFVCRREVC